MDAEHYEKDGKYYERVTRILDHLQDPALVDWKVRVGKKEANRISKMALKMGSRVHELIESGSSILPKDAEEVKNCMKAWESWKADYGNPQIANGSTLFCENRMIAGTPDAMMIDTLIDFKTSREVKAAHFIQLGAYASLMKITPKILAVLRLDKQNGIYEWITNEKIGITVEQCITAFNYLLGYYRFYRNVQSTLKPQRALPEGEIE